MAAVADPVQPNHLQKFSNGSSVALRISIMNLRLLTICLERYGAGLTDAQTERLSR